MNKKMSMRNYMRQAKNTNNYNQIVIDEKSNKEKIEELQRRLVTISEEYTSIPVVNINANYDDLTKKAIFKLQDMMGVPNSTNINKVMWDRICLLSSHTKDGRNSRQEEDMDESENVIKEGSKGKYVSDLQKYLNTVAEKYPSIPKLIVDGVFGEKTKNSVLVFQKLFDLEPDGVVGVVTWDTLYNISIGKKPPKIFD